jgi:probable rRNA maturation factor
MAVAVRVQFGDALAGGEAAADGAAVRRRLVRAVRLTLRRQAVADAEISVTLLADTEIADLNGRFLGHEGATDVISFALYDEGEEPVGDVYVGFEEAQRQAAANGVPFDEELVRLAVHGVLHVLGFDHGDGEERLDSGMWRLQEEIVAELVKE